MSGSYKSPPHPHPPKVILFDLGGVCVSSPFQAILDYEHHHNIPPGWINHSISQTAPTGHWHLLETGSIPLDAAFYAGFARDLRDPARWRAFYKRQQDRNLVPAGEPPAVPAIDAERLFDAMMAAATVPDPWMFPALQRLREADQFILAALSNTVIFPRGHALYREDFNSNDPVRRLFDVVVSSAHEGVRKPDPRAYRLALDRVNAFASRHADEERVRRLLRRTDAMAAEDVLFLDDIGENLREASRFGFRTIKVPLGRAYETVEELERVTGLSLEGAHPKVPVGGVRGDKGKL